MKNKIGVVSIYSLCHFIVDFVCAIFILGKLPYIAKTNSEFITSIIIYNFFAFAFQVPLGYILDKFKNYKYIAIIGLCLIGLCYLINFNNIFKFVIGLNSSINNKIYLINDFVLKLKATKMKLTKITSNKTRILLKPLKLI